MEAIYLALYKGNGGNWLAHLQDKLVRFFTRGEYSHCEIAIFKPGKDYSSWIDCYSCSPRDKGVRCKQFYQLSKDKWDLIRLPNLTETQIRHYFEKTKGKPYDWFGVFGLFLGLRESKGRYFCSEWCYNAIFNSNQGWRFSPNQLGDIVLNTIKSNHIDENLVK